MPINVWHLDDEALLGAGGEQSPPKAFFDAKIGFKGDGAQERACSELFLLGFYKLAASVDAASLEDAWHLTNHVGEDWQLNPGVSAQPGPQRSSSVGDLFEDAGGEWHLCASVGFKSIPDPRGAPRPPNAPKR